MTSLSSDEKQDLVEELKRRARWLLDNEGTTFIGATESGDVVATTNHRNAILESDAVDVFVSTNSANRLMVSLSNDRASVGIRGLLVNTDWSPDHTELIRAAVSALAKRMVLDDLAGA